MTERVLALCLVFCVSMASASQFISPYKNWYHTLEKSPGKLSQKDKVVVTVFFSFACAGCYLLEQKMRPWLLKKPEGVEYRQIPVVFQPSWRYLAKAYYASIELGIREKAMDALFTGVQVKGLVLNSRLAVQKFFMSQGVSEKDFDKVYPDDKAFDKVLVENELLFRAYHVFTIPLVIVNDKYQITTRKAKTFDNIMLALNHLVARELAIDKANEH